MRKLFFGIFALAIFSVSAYAVYGVLEWEEQNGTKTICHYSNGATITVGSDQNCPVSSH